MSNPTKNLKIARRLFHRAIKENEHAVAIAFSQTITKLVKTHINHSLNNGTLLDEATVCGFVHQMVRITQTHLEQNSSLNEDKIGTIVDAACQQLAKEMENEATNDNA